ncbi:hypothetical protein PTH_0634 [Pelotomaculum thermopropionicum SI]|uniref:Uncharacterized protein n=1 Tax=Pelotomaculum thermopropionicum (strain DSM 13744 / JCM 10971 / SI) TaxID=370438 RepID=A5D4N1_PELTS|nr:hypothetical protein PTH_0634 [Pelotomaculum thermopropionicum SI]
MIKFLFLKLRKFIHQSYSPEDLLNKIRELEKQIEQIKLQIDNAPVIKIEKIIIDKIICEKFETSYNIDSVATENLSGTMNIGTTYSASEQKFELNQEEKPIRQPEPEKKKINLIYK